MPPQAPCPRLQRLVTLNGHDNVLQDGQHPSEVWTRDVTRSALANSRDHGLVSCFVDPETELHVILAARIGKKRNRSGNRFPHQRNGSGRLVQDRSPEIWRKCGSGGVNRPHRRRTWTAPRRCVLSLVDSRD